MVLLEEQTYLDLVFSSIHHELRLNGSPTAGTAQGYRHSKE
jgi:hypothetical protein